MTDSPDGTDEDEEMPRSEIVGVIVGFLLLILIVLGAILFVADGGITRLADDVHEMLSDLGQSGVPADPEGGWLDRLFAADAFVGFTRLVLIAVGAWVFTSAVRHIVVRNWITGLSLSGFTTISNEKLNRLDAGTDASETLGQNADRLTARNAELEELVGRLYEDRLAMQEALEAHGVEFQDPTDPHR